MVDLRIFLTNNFGAMQLLRRGLTKTCLSSNDYNVPSVTRYLPIMGSFRKVMSVQQAEFKVALADGDTSRAIRAAVDGLRFGIEAGRGGVSYEGMGSAVLQVIALDQLRRIIAHLDRPNAILALDQLLQIESNALPTKRFLMRDAAEQELSPLFRQQTGGSFPDEWRFFVKVFIRTHDGVIVRRRLTAARVAKRIFELEKGRKATKWSDLVPDYLPKTLLDPTTGLPLVFH
jgi:hypothetical protein